MAVLVLAVPGGGTANEQRGVLLPARELRDLPHNADFVVQADAAAHVGVAYSLLPVTPLEAEALDATTARQEPATPPADVVADADSDKAREAFVAGFVSILDDEPLARWFIHVVLPCESAGQPPGGFIDWTPGNSSYHTAAQILPSNWPKIEAITGPLRFEVPFDVGRAVAAWVSLVTVEAINEQWPGCHGR